MCPGRGSNPYDLNGHRIFVHTSAFAAPDIAGLRGLDFLFAMSISEVGAACQVSTPFPIVIGTWLGIAMLYARRFPRI